MRKRGSPRKGGGLFDELRRSWSILSFYERFEQIVAIALTFLISIVIVVSMYHLSINMVDFFWSGADPLNHAMFQTIFGMIMTVLIAMEFKHSILKVWARKRSVVQVKTVVLIAILAISRKFILLDFKSVSGLYLASMAFSVLALGIVFRLVREKEEQLVYEGAQPEEYKHENEKEETD